MVYNGPNYAMQGLSPKTSPSSKTRLGRLPIEGFFRNIYRLSYSFLYSLVFVFFILALQGCQTSTRFIPKSQYPPDPWVKGYAKAQDCLGGEKLAARDFVLPDYPRRAFNSGRQGWVIMRLDVKVDGNTDNVQIERSLPQGLFDGASIQAVKAWKFAPPSDGALNNCRVLLRYRGGTVSLG